MKKFSILFFLSFLSLVFLHIDQTQAEGIGTIPQLQQFVATTSPSESITQQSYGKPLYITGLSPSKLICTSITGLLTTTGCPSSGGGGSGGGTFSTSTAFTGNLTTFYNRPNFDTDILTIGYDGAGIATSSSEAEFIFDPQSKPNPLALFLNGAKIGIGTTSPYAPLSVVGQVVGQYFTATSTTDTSIFRSIAGGSSINDDITIQGTSNTTKTTSFTYLEPSVGNGPQAAAGKVQIGTPDVTAGGLNGGIGRPPETAGGNAFVDGGGQLFITSPTQGDAVLGIRPYDNKEGLDFVAENQSGNAFIDTRYNGYSNTDYGTFLRFRMNTGGNGLSNNFAANAFAILTLNAGGSTSGGGMVGIGNGAFNPVAGLDVTTKVIASAGVSPGFANGTYLHQELTAGANNDILTALRVHPTFTNGAFTNIKQYGLTVDAGNSGFGTTTPTRRLQVYGSSEAQLGIDGTGRYSSATFQNTGVDKAEIAWDNVSSWLEMGTIGASPIKWYTNANIRMTLDSNGNLGISSTTPGSLLSVGDTQGINFSISTSTFSSTGGISLNAGCFAIRGVCISGGTISSGGSSDSFLHPFISGSATSTIFSVGTSTMSAVSQATIASSTSSQLSLSSGAGNPQFAFRAIGNSFYLSTTSVDGLATTTTSIMRVGSDAIPLATSESKPTIEFGGAGNVFSAKMKDVRTSAHGSYPLLELDRTYSPTTAYDGTGNNPGGAAIQARSHVTTPLAWYTLTSVDSYATVESATAATGTAVIGTSNWAENLAPVGVLSIIGSTNVARQTNAQASSTNIIIVNVDAGDASNGSPTKKGTNENFYGIRESGMNLDQMFTKNRYGLFIDTMTGVASSRDYAIWSVATQPSFFAGSLTSLTNLTAGVPNTGTGSFVLANANHGFSVTLKSSDSTTGSYTLKLPVDDGTPNQLLSTDGSGVLSWVTGASGGSGGGVGWATTTTSNEDIYSYGLGYVGIGTTTSKFNLTLATTTAPQLSLSAGAGVRQWTFANEGGNFYLATSSVDGLSTTTIPALTILGATNNLLLGTTSLSNFVGDYKLLLAGNNASVVAENINNTNTTGLGVMTFGDGLNLAKSGFFANGSGGTGTSALYGGGNSFNMVNTLAFPLTLATNQVVRLFISGTGAVGIATSTPYYGLTIASTTGPQMSLSNGKGVTQWTFRNAGGNLYFATTTIDGIATSTTASLQVDVNGIVSFGNYANCNGTTNALGITSGQILCDSLVSDQRLKTPLQPVDNSSLNRILALNPGTFYWKDLTNHNTTDPRQQYGFIAQDVEKIYPTAVGQSPDGYKTLDKTVLIPDIVNSIKILAQEKGLAPIEKSSDDWKWWSVSIAIFVLFGIVIWQQKQIYNLKK